MRGRLVACAAATLLSAGCITVSDFGGSWEKARVDGDLAGTWEAVKTPDGQSGEMTFVRRGESYALVTKARDEATKEASEEGRTLRVGDARLLLSRNPGQAGGMITAYRVTRDRLELLDVPDVAIGQDVPPPPPSVKYTAKRGGPASVDVTTLDQPALEWLARLERRAEPTSVFLRRP